jgi:MFS family permease
MILFVGYILFELPSNILLKKFGPRIWLSTLGICFGLLTIASGLVKSWGALAAVRAFLGVFEAVSPSSLPPILH